MAAFIEYPQHPNSVTLGNRFFGRKSLFFFFVRISAAQKSLSKCLYALFVVVWRREEEEEEKNAEKSTRDVKVH